METPTRHTQLRALRILWVQFLPSLALFTAVPFMVLEEASQPDMVLTMGPLLGGLALLSLGVMPLVRKYIAGAQTLPLLTKPQREPWDQGLDPESAIRIMNEADKRYRTTTLLGLALAESCTLFGFVLAWVTAMPIIILPFVGASALAFLWQYPTETGVQHVARGLASKDAR